jgi:hypothetical protein
MDFNFGRGKAGWGLIDFSEEAECLHFRNKGSLSKDLHAHDRQIIYLACLSEQFPWQEAN